MLSRESERFLREFRMELLSRGKDEDTIAELETELRDHLIEAESEGKTLDDVTNGSVDNYIHSISQEVPFENKLGRVIGVAAVGLFLMFVIPDLLNGTFEFTLSHIIYIVLLFVLGPLAIVVFLKHMIVEHTDFHSEKIDRMGYIKLTLASILFMALLVGGVFLYRTFPIYEFFYLELETTRLLGYIMFGFAVVLFIVLRQWIILAAILVVSLPQILAQLFTDSSPGDETYILITTISLFVLWFMFAIVALLMFRKKQDAS